MLSTVSLLAMALVAQAAPTPDLAGSVVKGAKSSFSIDAIKNPKHVRNGTAAMLQAYHKFNLKPTEDMSDLFTRALHKRQDGSVTASPYQNSEYVIPVSIGGEDLTLDLDTGSADLWVFSTELSSSQDAGHTEYDPSKSSSYQAIQGCSWSISYGDGSSSSGDCGTDTVTVGGTTVQSQVVELASTVSTEFQQDAGSDGLIGMAFSSINTVQPTQAQTFFANAQSSLQSPVLGAYLPNKADGAYDFGYTDSSKYSGDLVYADVDSSNGFWEYPSTSYKVGDQEGSMSGFTGISDTGTTLILMSDAAVKAYYAQVSGSSLSNSDGGYIFPCDATLPTLSFLIGDSKYATIPGSLINFSTSQDGNSCFGGVQSVGQGSMNIYGDVFLNAYYGAFDMGGPSFGFAPLN